MEMAVDERKCPLWLSLIALQRTQLIPLEYHWLQIAHSLSFSASSSGFTSMIIFKKIDSSVFTMPIFENMLDGNAQVIWYTMVCNWALLILRRFYGIENVQSILPNHQLDQHGYADIYRFLQWTRKCDAGDVTTKQQCIRLSTQCGTERRMWIVNILVTNSFV